MAALDPTEKLEPTWRHEPAKITISRIRIDGVGSVSERVHPFGTNVHGPLTTVVQQLKLDLGLMRDSNTVERADRLATNGQNLTNLISSFSRVQQGALANELSKRVVGIRDVDFVPTTSGRHQLRFHDRWSRAEFSPAEVSDGTVLMLAFLALKFQKPRPDVICVEEPERGLHPYLLGELVKFLRELTQGPDAIQVVLATHSAELLEHMKPEEVRFLSRSPEDGNVTVRTIDTNDNDWPRYFREYADSLGSAWLSGSLGGTPQTN